MYLHRGQTVREKKVKLQLDGLTALWRGRLRLELRGAVRQIDISPVRSGRGRLCASQLSSVQPAFLPLISLSGGSGLQCLDPGVPDWRMVNEVWRGSPRGFGVFVVWDFGRALVLHMPQIPATISTLPA